MAMDVKERIKKLKALNELIEDYLDNMDMELEDEKKPEKKEDK